MQCLHPLAAVPLQWHGRLEPLRPGRPVPRHLDNRCVRLARVSYRCYTVRRLVQRLFRYLSRFWDRLLRQRDNVAVCGR